MTAANSNLVNFTGQVGDPLAQKQGDGVNPPFFQGRSGEQIVSELRGKYANANDRGHLFSANRTGVTVPVVANNLVSVFGLYNPPNSGINVELVDFDYGLVLATTVVDTIGLYFSLNATGSTFTTPGVPGTNVFGGVIGGPMNPIAGFYSAVTHSGTPVRAAILGAFGAVTSSNDAPLHYDFDGKVMLAPGALVSVAMSTAASTSSGVDLAIRWLEYKI